MLAKTEKSAPLRDVRVLVVDDCHYLRRYYTAVLTRYGAEVTTAGSMAEALAAVRESKPHVILSDICMPDHDGFELIRSIRADEEDEPASIPAVAVTTMGREVEGRALTSGFDQFLQKPVDVRSLLTTIHGLARQARHLPTVPHYRSL